MQKQLGGQKWIVLTHNRKNTETKQLTMINNYNLPSQQSSSSQEEEHPIYCHEIYEWLSLCGSCDEVQPLSSEVVYLNFDWKDIVSEILE